MHSCNNKTNQPRLLLAFIEVSCVFVVHPLTPSFALSTQNVVDVLLLLSSVVVVVVIVVGCFAFLVQATFINSSLSLPLALALVPLLAGQTLKPRP